jgi:hypothetical protein
MASPTHTGAGKLVTVNKKPPPQAFVPGAIKGAMLALVTVSIDGSIPMAHSAHEQQPPPIA